jgi:hypothetical protein
VRVALVIDAIECGNCGVWFGMERSRIADRKQDGQDFYCVNGHKIHYSDNENARLRRTAERLRQHRDDAYAALGATQDQLESTARSLRATRAVVTRQRNRAAAGTCPVDGCHRHFANLARHIAGQHPDFTQAPTP